MAEKNEAEKVYVLLRRIYLGAALAFFAIGPVSTAIGIWSTARFTVCQQTIICDDDIIPPIAFVAMGLMSVVVGCMFASLYRHPSTHEETYNPFRGLGTVLLATGLAYLTLVLQQRYVGADLEYYQWMARQGTGRFVGEVACNSFAVVIGLGMSYRHRRPPW